MANPVRFLARRALFGFAGQALTSPLVRWTWSSPSGTEPSNGLPDFRPSDRETVVEMMEGRYLLASKLIDTQGTSPFSIESGHDEWTDELETFAWLRHFREARGDSERQLATMLALDFVGRPALIERSTPSTLARRVMNWLRHYGLMVATASAEQEKLIARALGAQMQALRVHANLATDPVEALLASIALVAVAHCSGADEGDVALRLARVERLLDRQIDDDGLHRSRSAAVQVQLLVELVTIHQALRHNPTFASELAEVLDSMHRALDAISLGTGEPGYFNGTGQEAHDLIVSIQAQSSARARATGIVGGYGRLLCGRAVVIADSGAVPEPDFARKAHAGALAFEFSHGRDLIVGNCGPAPSGVADRRPFRQGVAHSAPTIDGRSAARITGRGPLAGRVTALGDEPTIEADDAEHALLVTTHGYENRFGVKLERRLTLISDGDTLVGQDKVVKTGRADHGTVIVRFHLAPQAAVQEAADLVRIRLNSGAVWVFLWEGASMRVEDSVRHSAFFGFHRTRQIVLEVPVAEAGEINWIFTAESA